MSYDPIKHRRSSIRLKGYDYTTAGGYFVTLVSKNRENQFGEISGANICPNQAGWMLDHWWRELPAKFPQVILDYFVIMPNHLHGILWIAESGTTAEDLGASFNAIHVAAEDKGAHTGAPLQDRTDSQRVGADLRVICSN